MLAALARNWWVVALRGVFAIIFGILALIWPGLTLAILIVMFGAYAFVDGVLAVVAGIKTRDENERWWVVVLEGVAGIVLGLLTWFYPGATAVALVYIIAAWALITGVLEVVAAIQLRKEITGEWRLALAGILSILLGVILFVSPGAGALSLVWLIGAYAVVFGITLVILGFRLRGMSNEIQGANVQGTARV